MFPATGPRPGLVTITRAQARAIAATLHLSGRRRGRAIAGTIALTQSRTT